MAIIRAVARLPYFTGIPEDVTTNTFHYATGAAPTIAEIDAIQEGVRDFYIGAVTGASVGAYYAAYVSRAANACQVETYNLDDPEPRQPLDSLAFTLTAATGTSNLPAEAAVCLSYRAAYVSGSPNARRRGRAYIGPLSGAAMTAGSASAFPTPITGLVTSLLEAAQDYLAGVPDLAGASFGVYSPTDGAIRVGIEAWVDNAWDTQRRRGNAPSSRTTQSL